MPWLLDGNNLVGGGDRTVARRAALALARRERITIVLYFDGAPPAGTPDVERLGAVEVVYVPHVDTAVVARLRGGGRGWKVATDDRELGRRVRETGAEVVSSADFWRRAREGGGGASARGGAVSVEEEMRYFRDEDNRLDPGGGVVPRRRKRRRR